MEHNRRTVARGCWACQPDHVTARRYIEIAFRDGALLTTDTAITKVLPPTSRFSTDGDHGENSQSVIEKLGVFLERSSGLSQGFE